MNFLRRIIESLLNPRVDEDAVVEDVLYVGSDVPEQLADEFPDIPRSDIRAMWERTVVLLVRTYREEYYDDNMDG